MKKGKSKTLVAWLLAFAVLLSPSTGFRAFADDDPGGTEQDTVVGTTTIQDDEAAATEGQDSTDVSEDPVADQNDPAAEGEPQAPADADESTNADQPAATDEPTVTGEPASEDEQTVPEEDPAAEDSDGEEDPAAEEAEEPEYEDGGLINNLFIEEQALQAPEELNAIISFGEGEEQLTDVKLILTGDDGQQSEIPLTQKVLNYYQFKKTYESHEAGTYRLTSFTYELEGHKKRIDLKNTGISAQFTVITEEQADCEETAGVSVTAITSDEISTNLTYEIEDTIQEAAQEAVDNVTEGAVALDASSTEKSYSRAMTMATDRAVTLGSYSATRAYDEASKDMVIVLDPGHGGSDPGTSNKEAGLVESKLNLKVANYCKSKLETYSGVKVYMTRTGDTNPSLEQRVEIAKNYKADLFVSIHMNSGPSSAKGAEVYYPNQNYNQEVSKEGRDVARNILNELEDLGLVRRGIKDLDYPEKDKTDSDYKESIYSDGTQADYYSVIRNSKKNGFPGIIVEHAFITNEDDAKKLKDESFLKKLGEADADGIIKCYDLPEDSENALEAQIKEYSAVFDFDYYMNKYPSLKAQYLNDRQGAFLHFKKDGMDDREQASAEFNVDAYRKRYADLRIAFGTNYRRYYEHYMEHGKKEGRIATDNGDVNTSTNTSVDPDAVFDGVNYSDVYDYEYYIGNYPDLKAAFSGNKMGALEHFIIFGMSEARQAKGTFNVWNYKNRYPDLQKAFGSDMKSYYRHFIEFGKKEGRSAVAGETDSNGNEDTSADNITGKTTYMGRDYKDVYNYNYYINKYPDIKSAFGGDEDATLRHFVRHGMSEGRSGNADFSVYAYKNNYSDLRRAFGENLKDYFIHYIEFGKEEGRSCSLVIPTTYQGVDYSLVYDFEYYIGKYSDVRAAYENDPAGALQHFVETGIDAGYQACETFNIEAYRNNNDDLRRAFGDNNRAYVEHYISIGKDEIERGERADAVSFNYHLIMRGSKNTVTAEQLANYFIANNGKYPTYYANNTNVRTIKEFCQLYINECDDEFVDAEVAFCQAMKETRFLKFTGDVSISQYNFAGLGAVGNGAAGASFPDIQTGIRAHVQHLKAYASNATLKNPCVDPRFIYVKRGSAQYVEWLGIQENPIPGCGWAAEAGYGSSIVNDYMNKLAMVK